jgi:hypothetical protein
MHLEKPSIQPWGENMTQGQLADRGETLDNLRDFPFEIGRGEKNSMIEKSFLGRKYGDLKKQVFLWNKL